MTPAQLTAVVSDCDGLLVDTDAAWRHAVVATFGVAVTSKLGEREIAGASVGQLVEVMGGRLEVTDGLAETFTAALLQAVYTHARPTLGAVSMLRSLADRKHAIASNAPLAVVQAALSGFFENGAKPPEIVALDPSMRPKPAPDIYLEACRRLDVPPSDASAVEDSARGAKAARAAGLRVFGVGSVSELEPYVDCVFPSLADPDLLKELGLAGLSPNGRAGS